MSGKSPVFPFEPDFGSDRTRERFSKLTGPLKPAAMERDGSAYVDFLASQPFVGSGPMGVIGFCFAGKFALLVAAAYLIGSPLPLHSTAVDYSPTPSTAPSSSCHA